MERAKNAIKRLRLLHYALSGGVTFITEYGLFLLLFYAFSVSAFVANTIAFCIALGVSFTLNKKVVFRPISARRSPSIQIGLFGVLALFNLAVSNIGLHYLINMNVRAFIAKFVLIFIIAAWNYIFYKKVLFAEVK